MERTLDIIEVATPCPARWEDMKGTERVRRCEECRFNVYDLSAMTRAEAEALVFKTEGDRVCVRFYRRADGKVLTEDCPRGLEAVMHNRIYGMVVWFLALVGLSFIATWHGWDAIRPRHHFLGMLMQ